MKKILAMLLMLTMVAAVAVPAFATDINAGGGSGTNAGNGGGSYDLGVNGDFQPAADPDAVISVDIQWTQMKFTYNEGSKGVWNSVTHTYENAIPEGWDESEKATITVTNHSNCPIDAEFKFMPSTSGIYGIFTKSSLNIASADDDSYRQATSEGVLPAPSATTDFSIDSTSDELDASKTLGNITISIKKSEPKMVVGTEAELNAAIAALKTTGGTIALTSDLTLTNPVEIPEGAGTSASPLIIDFGGKTVNGRIAIVGTNTGRSYVTLKNGYVRYKISSTDTTLRDDPAQAAVYAKYTDLKLENLNISSYQLALRTSEGTKTLIEGEDVDFSGEYYSNNYNNIAIYNTSSEEFTLSATNGGDFGIVYYIVSNYAITLKVGGSYSFARGNGDVHFVEIESDTEIYSWQTYYAADTGKYERIILHTNDVTTAEGGD